MKRFLTVGVAALALLGASVVSAQDKVIKIASQSPLSGPQSVLGVSISRGVELAINQLSGPLTDMGFTVQYAPFDDEANPEKGVSNAQQIVNDSAILVVIGHLNSSVAIPSSEVYNDFDLAMISPANTNPLITDRGLPTVNRVCGRDDLQGPTGAQFANSLGVTSVYILHDANAYGQGVAEFFRQEAENLGITVLGFEGTEEQANFDGVIQPILALNPDMVYFGGDYSRTGIFINQARTAGFEGIFMGPDGFDSSEFASLAGDAGVGTYYTSVAGPASIYPNAAQYIEDYTAAYGEGPQPFSAQAYDATAIALKAIEAAAMEAGGEVPTRAAVAAAIRATQDYEGLTGTITFDANGDPKIGLYYVLQVGSADPAEWGNNTLLDTLEIPSPLTAAEMMGGDMGSIVEIAVSTPGFSTLVAAVQAAGLVETLSGEGPFTVFAPTDEAFAAALSALGLTAEQVLADTETLTAILTYHVIPGKVMSSDLKDGMTATTVNGADVTFSVSPDGAKINDANIIMADIEASNGVIHVIDAVILPPQ
ncbi:MAG: ABC transporter substrate-binding protein [Anaerolineae bacterium]|nr:ABC transporter substrate-binding protein [Anaerolineae bacterium]MDW8172024.1 ABC transporter substrate-binding protein [Anaerolineae bacterium]